MFDFAWSELALIGALSVLLLGPKQLPETMRTLAKVVRKIRGLSAEFQGHFNEMVREAELEELRDQVKKLSQANLQSEVSKVVDPTGEIESTLRSDPTAIADQTGADQEGLQPDPSAPQPAAAPAAAGPAIEAPAPEPAIQPPQQAAASPPAQSQLPPGSGA